MPKYTIVSVERYDYNQRYHDVEANSPEEAVEKAKVMSEAITSAYGNQLPRSELEDSLDHYGVRLSRATLCGSALEFVQLR